MVDLRWNFKVLPSLSQVATLEDWLVTLRKHRNYALRERIQGFETNNRNNETPIIYDHDSYCDLDSKIEYGSSCPLTCPVIKHGVIPQDYNLVTKISEVKDKKGKVIDRILDWDNASGIQQKVTSRLRHSNPNFSIIESTVLQNNMSHLDTAYKNFFKDGKGYPQFIRRLDSFEYETGRIKIHNIRKKYGIIYLPGIGYVKFHNSRDKDLLNYRSCLGSCVVKREGGYWFISIQVSIPESRSRIPKLKLIENCKSIVGIDVGINKLVALSDGSFIENKRFATNKRTARRMRIRQRSISRKLKGSKNKIRSIEKLSKQQFKIAQRRDGYDWQVASTVVKTAEAIAREALIIPNMVKRAKPKHDGKGGFKRNNAKQKTGLNKVILDASWGDIFKKIGWLALKAGKPVIEVNPRHSSQECPKCGHIEKANRNGEKFICVKCQYTEHADTKASRTIARRVGLVFLKNERTLPSDCGKVTPFSQSIAIETGNQCLKIACNPEIGYLRDTAEPLKESRQL